MVPTRPLGSELVVVTITTLTNATYQLPDMHASTLKAVLGATKMEEGPLTLVNISSAVLNIPARIVKVIEASPDGERPREIVWERK